MLFRLAMAVSTVVASLAAPSAAAAADFYVNDDGGSDANPCTSEAAPCSSITGALNKANASTGSGDTIWVDGGSYDASVDLGDGNSLRALDFDDTDDDSSAQPTIVAQSGFPAVRVLPGNPAGTVQGFRLQNSDTWAVTISDSVTLAGNTLDAIEDGHPGILVTGATDSPPVLRDNVLDAFPSPLAIGLVITGGSPTVDGNELRDLSDAITVSGDAAPTITDNVITGLSRETGFAYGVKVEQGGSPALRGNVIRDPDAPSATVGVSLQDDMSVLYVDAELDRNRILGQDIGVRFSDSAAVSLHSDLIAGNGTGLTAAHSGAPDAGPADVTATNVTIYDNGTDIGLSNNELTLDSSIVESQVNVSGTATCSIAHSAGPGDSGCPASGGGGNASFQFTQPPMFADAGYHLAPQSPLIDAGNPTPPDPPAPPPAYNHGSFDFDLQPRGMDGNCDGAARRDVGADELLADCKGPPDAPDPQADQQDTASPDTTITGGPKPKTKKKTAMFSFSGADARLVASFQCRLDNGPFEPCSSPKAYSKLKKGRHTFSVRAVDAAGNVDPTPATRSWKVKKKKRKK
jgi:hypothetical protein